MSGINPILLDLIKSAVKDVAGTVLSRPIADRPSEASVATSVVNQLKDDPVFINETNSEPLVQSRVAWGSVAAILSTAAALVGFFAANGFDYTAIITHWTVFWPLVTAFFGACYALYGRITGGLKPLGQSSVPTAAAVAK